MDRERPRHPHEDEIRGLHDREQDETSAAPLALVALIIIVMVVALLLL